MPKKKTIPLDRTEAEKKKRLERALELQKQDLEWIRNRDKRK